jgi:hypothetical protein
MSTTTLHRSPTIRFETPFTADKIDEVNAVIRGVSVMTAGPARGHSLDVDGVTLSEVLDCALKRESIPVKIGHSSDGAGAADVCGFLDGFRLDGGTKLLANLHLLSSHPASERLIEIARRMPNGVGLSASFISSENAPAGKARCAELLSVDIVTFPAANPDGFFSRKDIVARPDYSRSHRDFAARVAATVREEREGLRGIEDALRHNIPIPGAEQAQIAAGLVKAPLFRRVGSRLVKVAGGAIAGHYIGKKLRGKSALAGGAVAGMLFADRRVRANIHLSTMFAKKLKRL